MELLFQPIRSPGARHRGACRVGWADVARRPPEAWERGFSSFPRCTPTVLLRHFRAARHRGTPLGHARRRLGERGTPAAPRWQVPGSSWVLPVEAFQIRQTAAAPRTDRARALGVPRSSRRLFRRVGNPCGARPWCCHVSPGRGDRHARFNGDRGRRCRCHSSGPRSER